ncbi:hypothetical protein N0V88_000938 [Collariella sp. IMI 366227]|nr:hypothetical protein N0V88_000938 [Collariella sp. IMI 366227]
MAPEGGRSTCYRSGRQQDGREQEEELSSAKHYHPPQPSSPPRPPPPCPHHPLPAPPHLIATQIRALTFDVFGTCVNWRPSIANHLLAAITQKLTTTTTTTTTLTLSDTTRLANQWRASYSAFTRSFIPGTTPWKDIDQHHRDSLVELLNSPEWGLSTCGFTDEEVWDMVKGWHSLSPWEDSSSGVRRLNAAGFVTATLSNGNRGLLEELCGYAGLEFGNLVSAEDFRVYKPAREVYLGACERLRLEPGQVAMVAAHLGDLQAAREAGMRTVYVERKGRSVIIYTYEVNQKAWIRQENEKEAAAMCCFGVPDSQPL